MKAKDVILTAISANYQLNTHEDAKGHQFMCNAINRLYPSRVSRQDKSSTIRLIEKAMREDYEKAREPSIFLPSFTHCLGVNLSRIHGVDMNSLAMRQLKKQFWFDYFEIPLDTNYLEDLEAGAS